MMNLKDMALLLEAVRLVDDELRFRAAEFQLSGRCSDLKSVQINALKNYREEILRQFEDRHCIAVER